MVDSLVGWLVRWVIPWLQPSSDLMGHGYCCTTLRTKQITLLHIYTYICTKTVPLLRGCTQPAPGPWLRVVSTPPLSLVRPGRGPWQARCSPSSPLKADDKATTPVAGAQRSTGMIAAGVTIEIARAGGIIVMVVVSNMILTMNDEISCFLTWD